MRSRIVDAAERLFRTGGEEATSLRSITKEAGANVAAIHYHFGSRDQLLREVLDRQISPLNERRLELLEAAASNPSETVGVEELMDAFLRPDLELLQDLRSNQVEVARFLGRAYSQPSPVLTSFINEQFEPVAVRLLPLLGEALPGVTQRELMTRLNLVVSIVTGLFSSATPLGEPNVLGSDDIEDQLDVLLGFVVPAVSAPSTHPSPTSGS